MQNPCQPMYLDGRNITCEASAAVTGKRLVVISGNGTDLPKVAHAGAGVAAFGVAGYDAAIGEAVPVVRKGVVPITAGGAITAGDQVESDATGKVIKATTGKVIGTAVYSAASGADAFIAFP